VSSRPSSSWPNRHGFLYGFSDESNLTQLGAREYDPSIGRFVSVDPVMNLDDQQQWNGYAYANDNPITYSDPSQPERGTRSVV
jgi:RHS repeat-associated protein